MCDLICCIINNAVFGVVLLVKSM